MDSPRAREVLRLYRPGTTDALEPQMAEALQAVQRDPELEKWFQDQCAVYIAIRTKLKQIEVPPDLKRKILVEHVGRAKVIPLRRRPETLWAAAAAAILLLAASLWFFTKPSHELRFAQFRDYQVSEAQRGYKMTRTTNYAAIVTYLQTNHFIADYMLTKSLTKLPTDGFSTSTFQGKPVTMVCFNTGIAGKNGKTNEVFFFVAHRTDFVGSPPPGTKPQFGHLGHLTSATWSADDKVYILATQGDDADVQQYID